MTAPGTIEWALAPTEHDAMLLLQHHHRDIAVDATVLRYGVAAWLALWQAARAEGLIVPALTLDIDDSAIAYADRDMSGRLFAYAVATSAAAGAVDRVCDYVAGRVGQSLTRRDLDGAPLVSVRISETSVEAAQAVRHRAPHWRRRVYGAIQDEPGTDEEVSGRLGMSLNTVRPRRVELVRLGLVHAIGTRRSPTSGRFAQVWGATVDSVASSGAAR